MIAIAIKGGALFLNPEDVAYILVSVGERGVSEAMIFYRQGGQVSTYGPVAQAIADWLYQDDPHEAHAAARHALRMAQ